MNQEKLNELLSDGEFVKSLLELETAEEVQAALAEKGVDVTLEEIKKISELLEKRTNGELSDEELEEVAGGSLLASIVGVIIGVAVAGAGVEEVTRAYRRRW